MRRILLILLIAPAVLAGCVETTDEDPFAYMKMPLMDTSWELDGSGGNHTRSFLANDGSIVRMRIEVKADLDGPFRVTFLNPSDKVILEMEESGQETVAFAPGTWEVIVSSPQGTTGEVHVRVTRG